MKLKELLNEVVEEKLLKSLTKVAEHYFSSKFGVRIARFKMKNGKPIFITQGSTQNYEIKSVFNILNKKFLINIELLDNGRPLPSGELYYYIKIDT